MVNETEYPVVYLAGPIDQAGEHRHGVDMMRADARTALASKGAVTFDPSWGWIVPWTIDRPLPAQIQKINDAALLSSDGVLALLPAGVPTVGVPLEIALALQHQIPVVVVSPSMPTALRSTGVIQTDDVTAGALSLLSEIEIGSTAPAALLFTITDDRAIMPTRAYHGDAGYDLYVLDDVMIPPGAIVDVASGVAAAIPVGHYGRIVGRSSTFRKRRLSVIEGVIDAGYRGPLFSCVWNPSLTESVKIEAGDRVAQLIVTPVSPLHSREVDVLPPSDRGDRGFGSSGTGRLDR